MIVWHFPEKSKGRNQKKKNEGDRIGKLAQSTSSNSAFPMMLQVDLPRTFPIKKKTNIYLV